MTTRSQRPDSNLSARLDESWPSPEEFALQAVPAGPLVSYKQLLAGLGYIKESPRECGVIEMIVARPSSERRKCLEEGVFSPLGGLHGDRWATACHRKFADGSSDPAWQITLMNSRCLQLIAGSRERWPLAGDSLLVDLDLSEANLAVGSRLRVGSAILEIVATPHLGCKKFAARFGADALRFVNSPEGRRLRLRGAYARVVEPGTARSGTAIERLPSGDSRPAKPAKPNS